MLGKNAQNVIKKFMKTQCENDNQNDEDTMVWIKEKYRQHEGKLIVTLVSALLIGSWLFFADMRASMKSTEEQGKIIERLVQFQQDQIVINKEMKEFIKDLQEDMDANNERQLENYKKLADLCIEHRKKPPVYKLR